MEPLLEYLYKNCKEVITTLKHNLLASCMKIFDCFLEPYVESDYKKVSQDELDVLDA